MTKILADVPSARRDDLNPWRGKRRITGVGRSVWVVWAHRRDPLVDIDPPTGESLVIAACSVSLQRAVGAAA